jgi:imidazoleglycerol-phosphate dehydratase
MKARTAELERKSKETQIKIKLNIDGKGKSNIKSPVGFLNHMLELFAFHGFFDLDLKVTGDTQVDIHHTNEDIAIVLGKTFRKALGEQQAGIRRFGTAFAPMESTLGQSVVDLSGRGYLTLRIGEQESFPSIKDQEGYSISYLEHFLESFAQGLGATVFVKVENPVEDLHTDVETVFKSLGMALDQATSVDPRRKGVPSTKGIID